MFSFAPDFLDAGDRREPAWRAVAVGAALGLGWGIAARFWMRLIATDPELTVSGTAIILGVSTVFGGCAGLASAARRAGWPRWARYLCRGLVVVSFLPFGVGGGAPLMLTALLATVGLTQTGWPRVVRAVPLLAAAAGVVLVWQDIVKDQPVMLAALYLLVYLLLLYPLCLGLSTGLQRSKQTAPNNSKGEALVPIGQAT